MFRSYDHPQGAYFILANVTVEILGDLLRCINLVPWQRVCK